MKISEKDLIENGSEVDLPVEWNKPQIANGQFVRTRQCTIKYDKETNRFVMADIATGEIQYSYTKLSDLLHVTNKIYDYDDEAIEDSSASGHKPEPAPHTGDVV